MKKRSILLIITLVLLAVPFVLYAQHRRAGGGHFGMHAMHGMHGAGFLGHLQKLKTELDLSEAQTEQIKAIVREVHEQNADFRQQMHGGYMTIAKTLIANPSDTAEAQALLDRQTAAQRTLQTNLLNASSKALAVLTPQQRAKLGDLLDEHFERRGRRNRR